MHLWGVIRKIPQVYGVSIRNRSQPEKDTGHIGNDLSKDSERGTDVNRKDCHPQQVRLQSYKQMSAFLQNPKAGFYLDEWMWRGLPGAKALFEHPPLLSPSKEGEDLFLYLAVSTTVVSAALIREENRVQLPIYYVSQAFQGAEAKYPHIEKIIFALIVALRKLCPYSRLTSF